MRDSAPSNGETRLEPGHHDSSRLELPFNQSGRFAASYYAGLYDHHISPDLGGVALRELRAERIARWQADRLAAGAGPVAVRQALDLLGTVLQRAVEAERIGGNPVRLVRRARRPRRQEVRPLAPETVERMRDASSPRDATLLSVLAYAGLRPSEALAPRWHDVRAQTLLVERSLSLGEEVDTKTRSHRTVRLLEPLSEDLMAWRAVAGGGELLFPGRDGEPWSLPAYSRGAVARSSSPPTRPASSPRLPTRPGTRSPRSCSTRAAASSTSPANSVTTPA
jgi:integrase